ncbi:MAG TPA: nicotinate-nucleotide--dimethylbenzimidazole phosphoribosyltransferase [Actinomycetota bacterium]|nr:nicotinate-nucleotide--dimethylbenzimidazole phosphoribosyltransferase [Actinomycetota bacterium]
MIERDLPGPDERARAAVAERAARVLRPAGAFARLDEVAAWLAAWQRTDRPAVDRPALVVFAADHGVAAEGVSAYPSHVTGAMLRALRRGTATAPVLAASVGATVTVIDAGVGRQTGNIAVEPAMDEARFRSCWELGTAAVRGLDADLLVLGEMGIGNTTPAAAVAMTLYGRTPEDWTGRGTGVDDATLARKTGVVARACARAVVASPLDALREVGGAEMVAIAGAVVEARRRSIPVVLDGFVVTAAVAPVEAAHPGALDHCIAGHRSPEPGHALLLEKLGKEPLLDLGLRLGEGTGALASIPLIRLAAAAVTEVATFDEEGVAG